MPEPCLPLPQKTLDATQPVLPVIQVTFSDVKSLSSIFQSGLEIEDTVVRLTNDGGEFMAN